jgi:hypothetical protein
MSFKIALTPSYRVKVIVETPNESGRHDKSDFMAEFKRCDIDALEELRKDPQLEVLRKVLVGWDGLIGDDNQPVLYNPTTLEALLAIPQAVFALIEAFWGSIAKAKEKN